VPLILIGSERALEEHGRLADLAPTILTLLDVPIPSEMSGDVLVSSTPTD
jgi:2,3-bisphosphoglycerate-independent phosphoglycerate mutase